MEELLVLLGEELFNQVKAKLGDKTVIINDGSYIPKSRFDEVNEKKNGLQAQLETLNSELTKLKKTSKDNEDAVAQIEALQSKIKEKEAEAAKIEKKYSLREALIEAGAKFPDLIESKFDLNTIELENGKIKGLETLLQPIKESYKELFGETVKKGYEPEKGGNNPKPKNELDKLREKLQSASEQGNNALVMAIKRKINEIQESK